MKAWSLVLSKEVNVTKEGDHYVDQDGNLWNDFELACLQEEIDWQHYRIQAAIAAMNIVKGAYNIHNDVERFVHHSVRIADALIEELKGGEE